MVPYCHSNKARNLHLKIKALPEDDSKWRTKVCWGCLQIGHNGDGCKVLAPIREANNCGTCAWIGTKSLTCSMEYSTVKTFELAQSNIESGGVHTAKTSRALSPAQLLWVQSFYSGQISLATVHQNTHPLVASGSQGP